MQKPLVDPLNTELGGRNILVSGGTGALGQSLVEHLLSLGAQCYIPVYGNLPTDFPYSGHDRVHLIDKIDLSVEVQVVSCYAELPSLWASIHLTGGFAMAPLAETSSAEFERMWRMNALSSFLCCREAVKLMRRSPYQGGRIVNVAARPSVEPTGGMVAYTSSKAAVASLTESLARELVDDNILVNAVLPSIIDTPANRKAMPDADHDSWPRPAEIARTIAYLVSPANSLSSGALLPVYGKLL